MKTKSGLFVGLMSGTSTDGVDAVLCRINAIDHVETQHHVAVDFDEDLRLQILALNQPSHNELHQAALVANQLAYRYAAAVHTLLKESNTSAQDIIAIGVHGQTVRHAPDLQYTIQLNAPALLAELTGIQVIADFRSRDIAAGGQGAPLVPLFHQAVFSHSRTRVILNLGGIANISILRPHHPPQGFDTGPANALLDEWIALHKQERFDADGQWAATGHIHAGLLDSLLTEPWLQLAPPKSTGRDLFNMTWLNKHLALFVNEKLAPVDIQATLTAFTARSIALAIQEHATDTTEIIVCGGGAYNQHLLQLIQNYCALPIRHSIELGIEAQRVEATAFAWLAFAYWNDIAAGQPAITGAKHATILGAWYKA